MSWEAMANTIRSRFKSQIEDALPIVTQYDNESQDNPDNETWCRVTIKSGETMQASIGSPELNRDRTTGVMFAQLFCPVGKGDGDLREKADDIREAFKRVTDSGVTFRTPSIKELGIIGDSFQINVECPFYSDDIG